MTKDSPRTSVLRDEKLIARLRDAKRDWPEFGHDRAEAADRIEALTEQLAAARQDAKAAEVYAEELETKLATCEKYRDAYDEMGRIGTQAVRDLEVKLAECEARLGKAVEALDDVHRFGVITHPARATLAALAAFLET